jgi:hypothetical protein
MARRVTSRMVTTAREEVVAVRLRLREERVDLVALHRSDELLCVNDRVYWSNYAGTPVREKAH